MSKTVYTASPIFTPDDIATCTAIEDMLTRANISFFAPRLDTAEHGKRLGKANSKLTDLEKTRLTQGIYNNEELRQIAIERDEAANAILQANLKAIKECILLIANIDGRDPGTMFEIGYAAAIGKPIITYSAHNYGVNLMIGQSAICHALDFETLLDNIKEVLKLLDANYSVSDIHAHFNKLRMQDTRVME